MPRFLTLFPVAENVHLIKDVGMLPFILYKKFGYDSTIASYRNGEYPYLETEVKGLKQVFIKAIFRNPIFDVLWFLLFNFRKYDVVQCYHFQRPSLWFLFFFKVLKKITFSKGFTFLKLDAVDEINKLKLNTENKFLSKNINLVSVETKKLHDSLNRNNTLFRNVEYIPNGFYHKCKKRIIDFDAKKNLIITVGRIGTFQKNNEILLEAFKDFALINMEWKLEVIGPIEDAFQSHIKEYFDLNPNLIDKVLFTGSITDRVALEDKYNSAKIFVLTSRFEGFPLVFLEAIRSGCTIISSSIASAYDITDNEKYGALCPVGDAKTLAKELDKAVNNVIKLKNDCKDIQQFAYEKYSWSKISIRINELIQG
jgi:glycosyltransferase involved in cell wall biosynthesis